jgi:hypothetical protein
MQFYFADHGEQNLDPRFMKYLNIVRVWEVDEDRSRVILKRLIQ